jgi:GNAT superfamily N-acetyltransferase
MFAVRRAEPSELDVLIAIDDDASTLYAEHGIVLALAPGHEFVRAEVGRWLRAAQLCRAFLAVGPDGTALGFAALDVLDGEPYLDQLAVRVSAMRRGIGGQLLAQSAAFARAAGASALWLTTYGHLSFNRPYYERHGYAVVPESECGPGVRHHLTAQRRYLPAPELRVAMRRRV